ncbi:MAG: DMT family transporter [Lachnospiraceae bacterium]|nr:DMT family transporter [Lachnospiraceae bacterium]
MKSLLCAYGAVVIWSLAYIGTKYGLLYYDPVSLSIFRYLAAGLFALLLCVLRREKMPTCRDMVLFILLGASGYSLYVLTYNMGAGEVSVSAASIIISIAPVTTALFSVVLFHEKLILRQSIAALIEFAGVVLVCLGSGEYRAGNAIWWIVASMGCFTVYNLLTRYVVGKYSALQITEYSLIAALFMFLPATPYAVAHTKVHAVGGVICVLFLGVICSGAAYVLWAKAISETKETTSIANTLFLEPVITSLLGIITLSEYPKFQTWLGIGVVIFGLWLFETGGGEKACQLEK